MNVVHINILSLTHIIHKVRYGAGRHQYTEDTHSNEEKLLMNEFHIKNLIYSPILHPSKSEHIII